MGHSLQIPFSVLSMSLFFFFFFFPYVEFYPDDNKLLQFFCQLTTWSHWYTLSYLKLTKIISKRYHYLHLSKEEIEEIEGRWNNLPKVQKHSESRLDFRSLWIYMPLLQIVYTVWLSHKQKSTSESKVGYIRNSVICCCCSSCCLGTVPPSLSPGELAEHLN